MSYDIYLADKNTNDPLETDVKHGFAGGTYTYGGTTVLELNVTYNYSSILGRAFRAQGGYDEGIRSIYDMTGAESLPLLEKVAGSLSGEATSDYWDPTEGNAKAAIMNLIALANLGPEGIWRGD